MFNRFASLLILFNYLSCVYLVSSFNYNQFVYDVSQYVTNLTQSTPTLYWNKNGSCFIPSDVTSIPVVSINTVADLESMPYLRSQYPPDSIVAFQLTGIDIPATKSQAFVPAYLVSSTIRWYSNMSCSYVVGMGNSATSVLADVNHARLNFTGPSIQLRGVSDIIIADMTLDRTNSSYWNLVYPCLMAINFPALVASPAKVLANHTCVQVAYRYGLLATKGASNAIQVQSSLRTHLLRIRSWGGVAFVSCGYFSVYSSTLNSLENTLTAGPTGASIPYTSQHGIFYNNTISGIFGDCIYMAPGGFHVHHNYVYDCGYSPIQLGWSSSQLIEYNYLSNYSFIPGAGGGAAGVYVYGGWEYYNTIIRNNWFYAPGQKCIYFDDFTSNIHFENNICYTITNNEINGGRYNMFYNNLMMALLPSKSSSSNLGNINCRGTSYSGTTPYNWASCANVIAGTAASGPVSRTNPWTNLYPNGTIKSPTTPIIQSILARQPNVAYSNFCAPTTAGPTSVQCTQPGISTVCLNGVNYSYPCELMPSNNHFGDTTKVGWIGVYNTTSAMGSWVSGYGCNCNINKGLTSGCPYPAPSGWDPMIFNIANLIPQLNYFNQSYYNWATYNTSNPTSLFGYYFPLNHPGYKLTPSIFKIARGSKLANDHPSILSIPISLMGLALYTPLQSNLQLPSGAFTTPPPTSVPTLKPSLTPTSKPPTIIPSPKPTLIPSSKPTTFSPTVRPSGPSSKPTSAPIPNPTTPPSSLPSSLPTLVPSADPSATPSCEPTSDPTTSPTQNPSADPTADPTALPTVSPTSDPTTNPTSNPTLIPSTLPTPIPTIQPTVTPLSIPTSTPSLFPTRFPTPYPTTRSPSSSPSISATNAPNMPYPTLPTFYYGLNCGSIAGSVTLSAAGNYPAIFSGVTGYYTNDAIQSLYIPYGFTVTVMKDYTGSPAYYVFVGPIEVDNLTAYTYLNGGGSLSKSISDIIITYSPTSYPTALPTVGPSPYPTSTPTSYPIAVPSVIPSPFPTSLPTAAPTTVPTSIPTNLPTPNPTSSPTCYPTYDPSSIPTANPSSTPSYDPSSSPTSLPTFDPSSIPTASPTPTPSSSPSIVPTPMPSTLPTSIPTASPTSLPTSSIPTSSPTFLPSFTPSSSPSYYPTRSPSRTPSLLPTISPTAKPTNPTSRPTISPSKAPNAQLPVFPTFYYAVNCGNISGSSVLSSPGSYHASFIGNPGSFLNDAIQSLYISSGYVVTVKKDYIGSPANYTFTGPIEVDNLTPLQYLYGGGSLSKSISAIVIKYVSTAPTVVPTSHPSMV